ncbi:MULTISPECIES: PAAR domain-containing protein [Burkholderia]|uniref:PAAR domain-containing protein n=1 Tax=Burkholderia TaxID=32008 RepID=UPI000754DA07|nr:MULTISPECIES: PAAR domain-containing protein [Burkholderia]KVQ36773.1 hypothetical protein WK03_33555 [Burkholderia cepacia]KWH22408.1 hypothetical protein WL99_27700 [Burkholderia cepacia]MBW5804399.1 PAAR domain-containing protein [Burkholderia sp. COPS]
MKILGWIRQGDQAACGAPVSAGDAAYESHGRSLAYRGASMACPKRCVIAEGHPDFVLPNGCTVPHHGQRTSGGCPLQSSLNDVHGLRNASGKPVATTFYLSSSGTWLPRFGPERLTNSSPDEQVRAIDPKTGRPIPHLAYYIEAPDGSVYMGHTDAQGLCKRIATHHLETLIVWFGEEATRKQEDSR